MELTVACYLQNDIHNKVVAYEYSDAGGKRRSNTVVIKFLYSHCILDKTLSGFIITLLKVGKNAQEVNDELLLRKFLKLQGEPCEHPFSNMPFNSCRK